MQCYQKCHKQVDNWYIQRPTAAGAESSFRRSCRCIWYVQAKAQNARRNIPHAGVPQCKTTLQCIQHTRPIRVELSLLTGDEERRHDCTKYMPRGFAQVGSAHGYSFWLNCCTVNLAEEWISRQHAVPGRHMSQPAGKQWSGLQTYGKQRFLARSIDHA